MDGSNHTDVEAIKHFGRNVIVRLVAVPSVHYNLYKLVPPLQRVYRMPKDALPSSARVAVRMKEAYNERTGRLKFHSS